MAVHKNIRVGSRNYVIGDLGPPILGSNAEEREMATRGSLELLRALVSYARNHSDTPSGAHILRSVR